jgi:hypothetical protein
LATGLRGDAEPLGVFLVQLGPAALRELRPRLVEGQLQVVEAQLPAGRDLGRVGTGKLVREDNGRVLAAQSLTLAA